MLTKKMARRQARGANEVLKDIDLFPKAHVRKVVGATGIIGYAAGINFADFHQLDAAIGELDPNVLLELDHVDAVVRRDGKKPIALPLSSLYPVEGI